jgi:tRNA(Ile)-lysidine synthase
LSFKVIVAMAPRRADAVERLHEPVRRCLCALDGIGMGIVVAVSGGPDSVALLRAVVAARSPETPVIIAHLNHQLRGPASDADEAFVAALHESLRSSDAARLSLRTERVDVAAARREEGGNLEATARTTRYRWLCGVARETGARWVATGHTADDQAETVLHRLLRGTGLQGLRGIASQRPLADDVAVVRPLLHVTRADVMAYLREVGQGYREDQTNADMRLTRNRIRHELLPLLAANYNPAVVEVLGRLAEQADEAHRQEEADARALLAECELPRAESLLVLDAERLDRAPRRLVRVLFRFVWARESWPTGRMDFATWQRLAALLDEDAGSIDLPDGLRACRRGRVVQIGPHDLPPLSSRTQGDRGRG